MVELCKGSEHRVVVFDGSSLPSFKVDDKNRGGVEDGSLVSNLVSEGLLEEVVQLSGMLGDLVDIWLLKVRNQTQVCPLPNCPICQVQAWIEAAEPLVGLRFKVP